MTLDLSFKELVDAAANPNAATGRPLLVAIDALTKIPINHAATLANRN